ncbi:MAG: hypothetical protein OEM78_13265 [Gammaproteobacteria bacterium]|nr:hypothetical protein [Gammaproteobacteria bacterium]
MIRSNGGKHWATLTILALAAGSAAAADTQESRHLEMEVVEVVEKFVPAPVRTDDYFLTLAADLSATLGEELRQDLAASVMTAYQLLSAELGLRSGSRVAAIDTQRRDGSDTEVKSL